MAITSSQTQTPRPWLWPVLVSVLLLGMCVWLLVQFTANSTHSINPEETQSYKTLQEEITSLQTLYGKDPCTIAKALGISIPKVTSKAPPITPPPIQDTAAKTSPDITRIENATVLVIGVNNQGDVSIGTGFFVAPQMLVTNHHVIAGTTALFITNKALASLMPVTVKAHSSDNQRDYALLQTNGVPPVSVGILPLSLDIQRTEKVSAWGYPTAVSKNDPQFLSLLQGNIQSIPEVIYSEGVIAAILNRTPKLIAHTTPLSAGNSGGPLLNAQGHVVGINTMISLDDDSYRQTSLSLPSEDLLNFLHAAGVKPDAIVKRTP